MKVQEFMVITKEELRKVPIPMDDYYHKMTLVCPQCGNAVTMYNPKDKDYYIGWCFYHLGKVLLPFPQKQIGNVHTIRFVKDSK